MLEEEHIAEVKQEPTDPCVLDNPPGCSKKFNNDERYVEFAFKTQLGLRPTEFSDIDDVVNRCTLCKAVYSDLLDFAKNAYGSEV